jgi:hypothetical protein
MNEQCWIELAKIAQQSFFNRREVEWKLAIGFWTAIGAFTWAFFAVESLTVPPYFCCALGFIYLLLFLLTIPFWHLPIQKAHSIDKQYYHFYIKKARGVDCDDLPEGYPNTPRQQFLREIFTEV